MSSPSTGELERPRTNPKRCIGFEEAGLIFAHACYEGRRSDFPEQFRAIGWVAGRLYSVVLEVRDDSDGEYYHSEDEIAGRADRGQNISAHFTNKGTMKKPAHRVNVGFTVEMLKKLDAVADELNISRQAVIKSYLRQALDQHYQAKDKLRSATP